MLADLGASSGPLCGVLSGLTQVSSTGEARWLLTVPGDTPFIPADLVVRLAEAATREDADVVHARSDDRDHPLVALWSVAVFGKLRRALANRGVRGVSAFQSEVRTVVVAWPVEPYDPFFNVNTPDDLARARRLASQVAPTFR